MNAAPSVEAVSASHDILKLVKTRWKDADARNSYQTGIAAISVLSHDIEQIIRNGGKPEDTEFRTYMFERFDKNYLCRSLRKMTLPEINAKIADDFDRNYSNVMTDMKAHRNNLFDRTATESENQNVCDVVHEYDDHELPF